MKTIQEQRSGAYVIRALNETGRLQQGQNSLVLEFRNASDNRVTDPGPIQVQSSMEGMPAMSGNSAVTRTIAPGRYEVTNDFSMAGTWNLVVTFGRGEQAKFALAVE